MWIIRTKISQRRGQSLDVFRVGSALPVGTLDLGRDRHWGCGAEELRIGLVGKVDHPRDTAAVAYDEVRLQAAVSTSLAMVEMLENSNALTAAKTKSEPPTHRPHRADQRDNAPGTFGRTTVVG